MSAKIDPRIAVARDDLAEPYGGFAIRRELFDRRGGCVGGQHGNHADSAIECAQHFGFGDFARRRQPFEDRQDRDAVEIDRGAQSWR